MRHPKQKTGLLGLFIFVAIATFISALFYRSCGSLPLTADPSASPTPATATQSAGAANQTKPEQSQNSNTATPDEDRATPTQVKGTVRREGSSEVVTGAVVVLFNGDRRGAEPQKVDETGQFRFEKIPIRSGATYSLQTKLPGLCGEKSFTSEAIDAQQTISGDIVLKPCQTQAPAPQVAKTEDPNLLRISEGMTGITGPLNSMTFWVQSLAITCILTIVTLLAMAVLIFLNRRQAREARALIEGLYRWKQTFESDARKPNPVKEPSTATLAFPAEVSESLRQLPDLLATIARSIPSLANQTRNSEFTPPPAREEKPRQFANVTTPFAPAPEVKSYDSPSEANNWYRRLLQNETTSRPPCFVQINGDLSDTSLLATNPRICFDECQNHGPFVVFAESDASGWIFPSPGSNFTADHHRVFETLDQKNFDQQRANIIKKEVIFQDGRWRLVL